MEKVRRVKLIANGREVNSAPPHGGGGIRGQRYFRHLASAGYRHIFSVSRIGQHEHERTVGILSGRVIYTRGGRAIRRRCYGGR